ncbi:unnamed protein product [Heligmosomoides polygyrus]|uniref:Uncharacterized protein n=1 Tax=Heligmosomoides polygyrus TaxID=6339 RepID=A0A3P7WIH4_HELPZ|nr:unnamed protein product [Heligmosomoides polygyrus]
MQLTQLVFSTELVIFPKNALIFEISENPHLSITIIQLLKNLCPKCVITANLGCDLASRYYSDKELVAACAGKRIIRPASGFMLQLSSPRTTEAQFNAICSKAVFMEICIIITNTAYKSLRCPYLKELHPCQPGRPAISIVNNPKFSVLVIPSTIVIPSSSNIFEITGNPLLPKSVLDQLRKICPRCPISATNVGDGSRPAGVCDVAGPPTFRRLGPCDSVFDLRTSAKLGTPEVFAHLLARVCPTEARPMSNKELVSVCAGAEIIRPQKGFILNISSDDVTERQMNALCSKAVYMEICITIAHSTYKSLRCPHLRELHSCLPGIPAIRIVDNLVFTTFEISKMIFIDRREIPFEISGNPHLKLEEIEWLQRLCPHCTITANLGCDLEGRVYSDKELIAACAGKTIIRPAKGFLLHLSSPATTEEQFNALCSKAVYMEICIEIVNSSYKSLRCPNLKELHPCRPGEFQLRIRRQCPDESREISNKELVKICAGAEIIKPQKGFYLNVTSMDVTEVQMNALCSKAIYMEICITIVNSSFKSLRCPYLRRIKPCLPGVPAIRIVGNLDFREFTISKHFEYTKNVVMFEIAENPHFPVATINTLKKFCPRCTITANLGCDLESRYYSEAELVAACAGKRIIRPAVGFMLQLSSSRTTEAQFNALCSKAVYMQICVDITRSSFKHLRCPFLQELIPCLPGEFLRFVFTAWRLLIRM